MFALLVPGCPVTEVPQVEALRFAVQLPSRPLHHLVVWVTIPFPEGFGCSIHLQLPNQGWRKIGRLSNQKPSAVFKLSGLRGKEGFSAGFGDGTVDGATVGILCEPLEALDVEDTPTMDAVPSTSTELVVRTPPAPDPLALATRIATHLFNSVAS